MQHTHGDDAAMKRHLYKQIASGEILNSLQGTHIMRITTRTSRPKMMESTDNTAFDLDTNFLTTSALS